MSRYKVEELCFSLSDDAKATKFKADPDAFSASFALTEAERQAVTSGDVGALYIMGIITQAILFLSRAFGYDNATYVSKLRQAAGLPKIKEQIEILRRR